MSVAVIITIVVLLLLFIWWNMFLPFYKDWNKEILVSDESKCFSDRCKSIIYKKEGNKRAILMIHGFPSTPQMYEYASARCRDASYDVYVPLIPTFGSDWHEFAKTNFTQWFTFISSYYEKLRKEYDFLAVLGVSMGGAMTLKIAEKYSSTPLAPDKIVVISAPVAYNNIRYHIFTSKAAYFARTVGLFKPCINPHIIAGRKDGNDGNEDWTGYGGTYIKQGLSLSRAFDTIRKDLKKIKVPMFEMHDRGDKTVPFNNLAVIEKFCHDNIVVCRKVEMKGNFNHSHHSLLMYHSVQKEYMDDILNFLGGKNNG